MNTVLITGIGKGIGKALAQKFLAEGYRVLGTTFSSTLDYAHENLRTFQLDLSFPENISNCIEKIKAEGDKIDILINNAGVLLDDEETKVVTDKLRKTLEVNLIGTVNFTEQMISLMKNSGHIINISSSAGSLDRVGTTKTGAKSHFPGHYPSYKISKSALNMYTRTLALRMKDTLTVSSVHPGWVKTDMGGEEAEITPEEAADKIYSLAVSRPETGQFWFNGEKYPW